METEPAERCLHLEHKDLGYMTVCATCGHVLSPHLPPRSEYIPKDPLTGLTDFGELNERRARATRYAAKMGR